MTIDGQMTFDEVFEMETFNGTAKRYEYGVIRDGDAPFDLHRGPMTRKNAVAWIDQWEIDVAPQARKGMFKVVRREVGAWEPF